MAEIVIFIYRRRFLIALLLYSLLLFLPVSVVELALPDNADMELAPLEQDLLMPSQETAIQMLGYVTYPRLTRDGISVISMHLGGHAPPIAG